tara:strand:- start:34 stop:216 length:183 start_codon:yes stop_codon:yes gene_type:complete
LRILNPRIENSNAHKKTETSEKRKKKTKTFNMKCFIQVDLVENDEKSKSARTYIQALIII